jgi:hypothetical protein
LIDELWEPRGAELELALEEGAAPAALSGTGSSRLARPLHVLCLPARDEADEIVGVMLAQILESAGHRAQCIPVAATSELLAQVREEKPDVVCISALPPFAIPHARSLYSKLHAQEPSLKIIVGLWHFSGDAGSVSRRLGLADGSGALTTLAEFHEALQPAPVDVPVSAD